MAAVKSEYTTILTGIRLVPDSRTKILFLTGVFIVCMCSLMLQIMETRLLSVIAWYYMAFFAISMAMFGMTAGSLIVYFRSQLFTRDRLYEHLAWIAAALAISVVLSTASLVSSVVPSTVTSVVMVLLWLKLIVSILPPYVFAGMAVSLALTRSPWPVGQVYGVDLVGAASGCLLGLAVLSWMDGVSALIAVAALAALAAAGFRAAWRTSSPALPPLRLSNWFVIRHPLALLAVPLLAIAVLNTVIQPHGLVPTVVKDQLELQPPAAQQWNSFSRVRVALETIDTPYLWGPSAKLPPVMVSQHWVSIDGSAGTTMYRFEGDLSEVDFLRFDVTNLAYAIRNRGRAAIIGVGGGRDLLSAYLFGFRDITGVELNPVFIDLLTHQFRSYNRVADLAGVRFYVDEGRSWFARTGDKFDLVEMSLIDTWAATGAGAYSLSENGLYTVEGWQHFLNALTPGGVFTVSRWYNPNDIRETARLLSLAVASLRLRGVANPETHVFLACTPRLATIIVANATFSADELAKLRDATTELGFTVLVSPDQAAASPVLAQVMRATSADAFASLARSYHIDLTPPTDDRPFFFNQLLLTDFASIEEAEQAQDGVVRGNLEAARTIGVLVLLSFALVLCTMIVPSLPSVRRTPGWLGSLGTLYFALIGLGFMFVEIGMIQRVSLFLGHPVYGMAIGLFSIILSTGVGSLLSERLQLDSPRWLLGWSGLLFLFIVLLTVWFPILVRTFEGGELPVRVLVSLIAIVPAGILMGFGFPTGMRLVNAIDTRPTPWFWAVNGSAGVLAAGLAVATSIALSINVSLWTGAVCYLLLGPISLALRRFCQAGASPQLLSADARQKAG
jgi:SAM-dependent methyltransferase